MAEFSSQEKRNLSFKHVLGIVGTNNLDGANGRQWYEELIAGTHPVYLPTARADIIPYALDLSTARSNATLFDSVEDRSQGESITLVSNGSDWDINTSTIVPRVGYQITDVHPNPSYIKSITNVVDNGGGSYTITLNSNVGVSPGSAVLNSRIYLTLDPTSNNKTWVVKEVYGDFFSDRVYDFLSPIEFGRGYTVNLFQADGTQVQVTQGAWLFNWAEGLLIFADGFTAVDEGYSQPLYIEGFRYDGTLGAGSAIDVSKEGSVVVSGATELNFDTGFSISGSGTEVFISYTGAAELNTLDGNNLYDTLFWNGTEWEPTDTVSISGLEAIVSSGNTLNVEGDFVVYSGIRPGQSIDPGREGTVRWDYNYLYLNTGLGGWRRVQLAVFGLSPGSPPPPPYSSFLGLAGMFQTDFSVGTDLDSSQNPVPMSSTPLINKGGVFSLTASGVNASKTGYYKVTWNLEGEITGGTENRRILTTSVTVDGVEVNNSFSDGYARDATNNTASSQNTIIVKIDTDNKDIAIKSQQTGDGDAGGSSFLSTGGHFLIEYVGGL